jgi:hypothetical protein
VEAARAALHSVASPAAPSTLTSRAGDAAFPPRIWPKPHVEQWMEQKHRYVRHLLGLHPRGAFPPTRIIGPCSLHCELSQKQQQHTAGNPCLSCLQQVSASIEQVLHDAHAGNWMGAARGVVSSASASAGLASERALILKADGTRGHAGVVFRIQNADQYLDGATGKPIHAAWLE